MDAATRWYGGACLVLGATRRRRSANPIFPTRWILTGEFFRGAVDKYQSTIARLACTVSGPLSEEDEKEFINKATPAMVHQYPQALRFLTKRSRK